MSTLNPLQQFVKEELGHMPVVGRAVVDDVFQHLQENLPRQTPDERAELASLIMGLKERAGRIGQAFSDSVVGQVSRQLGLDIQPSGNAPSRTAFAETSASPIGLTLVGENAVNSDVQIAHCATEIKAVSEFELRELATFASALCGEQHVERNRNPFLPEVMARALWESSSQLSQNADLRNLYIRQSGPRLAQYLRRYYASLCGKLEDRGIQPAAYRTVVVPTGAKVDREGWTLTDEALRGITQRMEGSPNPPASVAPATRPFSPEGTMWSGDLAAPLTPRTAGTPFAYETQPASVADLGAPFRPVAAAPQAQPLTPAEPPAPQRGATAPVNSTQYLSLLNRLFDIILAERRLPRDIKLAISRLQAPAMRLAIHDQTLLSAHDHPLWALTDHLAWLGETLPGHEDPLRQTEMAVIDTLLGQIAATEDQRPALYSSVLHMLKGREAARFTATVQRLQKVVAQLGRLEEPTPSSSGSEPLAPMEASQFETVPSALLDFSQEPLHAESSETWLGTRRVGDHVRLFVDNAWAHVRLAWVNERRDIFLWADCQSPRAWPIRAGAMRLLHNEGLAVHHSPRSLVRAAARMVANQIAQARKA